MRYLGAAVLSGLQDNPSAAAGICTFAVAFSLVAGNALYGQNGGHPVPLFATRDATITQSVPSSAVAPRRVATRPVESAAQIPVPEMRPRAEAPAAEPSVAGLVGETQAALKAAGFYGGEVDGLYGPKTREAILNFEKVAGLPQTGLVNEEVASRAAQWRGQNVARRDAAPQPVAKPREAARVEPARDDVREVSIDIRDVRDAALIARVQIGLINFGETGISVDGLIGEQTISAIRNFQSRYGLPVTGVPDDVLLRKMEQIGALKKS